jgi:hypothetical protein
MTRHLVQRFRLDRHNGFDRDRLHRAVFHRPDRPAVHFRIEALVDAVRDLRGESREEVVG